MKLRYDNDKQHGDLVRNGGNIEIETGLKTAVEISLYTDRRAPERSRLPGDENRTGGWWADQFHEVPGDQIGSLLWLLEREQSRQTIYRQARRYGVEALDWTLEDDVARTVTVTAERARADAMLLCVTLERPNKPGEPWRERWEVETSGI